MHSYLSTCHQLFNWFEPERPVLTSCRKDLLKIVFPNKNICILWFLLVVSSWLSRGFSIPFYIMSWIKICLTHPSSSQLYFCWAWFAYNENSPARCPSQFRSWITNTKIRYGIFWKYFKYFIYRFHLEEW